MGRSEERGPNLQGRSSWATSASVRGERKGGRKVFLMSNGKKEWQCGWWVSGSLQKDVSEDVSRSANCDMIVAFFRVRVSRSTWRRSVRPRRGLCGLPFAKTITDGHSWGPLGLGGERRRLTGQTVGGVLVPCLVSW